MSAISSNNPTIVFKDLTVENKPEMLNHFMQLSETDLRFRFQYRGVDATAIEKYVDKALSLDAKCIRVFGAYMITSPDNKPVLVGVGHLTVDKTNIPDISLSVEGAYRKMGIGSKIINEAAKYAKERNFTQLKFCFEATNRAMIRVAQKERIIIENCQVSDWGIRTACISSLKWY